MGSKKHLLYNEQDSNFFSQVQTTTSLQAQHRPLSRAIHVQRKAQHSSVTQPPLTSVTRLLRLLAPTTQFNALILVTLPLVTLYPAPGSYQMSYFCISVDSVDNVDSIDSKDIIDSVDSVDSVYSVDICS